MLAEQHDERAKGRRHLGLELLAKARVTIMAGEEEVADLPLAVTV